MIRHIAFTFLALFLLASISLADLTVPPLSSNTSANVKLYLDFDGDPASTIPGFNVPITPPFNSDQDPTNFGNMDLDYIRQIWAGVADKFSPFNVDVTTVDPGAYLDNVAIKIVFGGNGTWFPHYSAFGRRGAFFEPALPNVAYVFTENYRGLTSLAIDNASAVIGLSLGLEWQSKYDSAGNYLGGWNDGNDSISPIMGFYGFRRMLWWIGRNDIGYDFIQDDFNILGGALPFPYYGGRLSFGFRADDHGNTIATASAIAAGKASGIIGQPNDIDYLSFTTPGGVTKIDGSGRMLDLKLRIFNSSGAQIASADTANLNESVTQTLAAGTYYIAISGHGLIRAYDTEGNDLGQGVDVGQYNISVSHITIPLAPSALSASAISGTQISLSWSDNSSDESGFIIERALDSGFTRGIIGASVAANVASFSVTGLAVNTTYFFRVHALNPAGSSAQSNVASAQTVAPPAAPSSLYATAASSSQINLRWTDNAGNETIYSIERALDSGFTQGLQSTTYSANTTSGWFLNLSASTTYYFRVRAQNSAGYSAYSNIASAQTLSLTPKAPASLVSTPASASQIILRWTDYSSNESAFVIDRALDSAFTQSLVTVSTAANTSYFSVTGLAPATTYFFRARASNNYGDSENSNTASATTAALGALPAAPSSLSALTISSTQVNLSWLDNSTNEATFILDRALDSAFNAGLLSVTIGANTTSYSALGLSGATTYYFRIRAQNSTGASTNSNTASATTIIPPVVTIPAAPSSVSVSALGRNKRTITWSDNSDNENGFILQYSSNGTIWTPLVSVAVNTTTYVHSTKKAYLYRIASFNAAGQSAFVGPESAQGEMLLAPTISTETTLAASVSTKTRKETHRVKVKRALGRERVGRRENFFSFARESRGVRTIPTAITEVARKRRDA